MIVLWSIRLFRGVWFFSFILLLLPLFFFSTFTPVYTVNIDEGYRLLQFIISPSNFYENLLILTNHLSVGARAKLQFMLCNLVFGCSLGINRPSGLRACECLCLCSYCQRIVVELNIQNHGLRQWTFKSNVLFKCCSECLTD